ncbi:hypothetical protein COBT_002935, partial [Conglomerata obtusa]
YSRDKYEVAIRMPFVDSLIFEHINFTNLTDPDLNHLTKKFVEKRIQKGSGIGIRSLEYFENKCLYECSFSHAFEMVKAYFIKKNTTRSLSQKIYITVAFNWKREFLHYLVYSYSYIENCLYGSEHMLEPKDLIRIKISSWLDDQLTSDMESMKEHMASNQTQTENTIIYILITNKKNCIGDFLENFMISSKQIEFVNKYIDIVKFLIESYQKILLCIITKSFDLYGEYADKFKFLKFSDDYYEPEKNANKLTDSEITLEIETNKIKLNAIMDDFFYMMVNEISFKYEKIERSEYIRVQKLYHGSIKAKISLQKEDEVIKSINNSIIAQDEHSTQTKKRTEYKHKNDGQLDDVLLWIDEASSTKEKNHMKKNKNVSKKLVRDSNSLSNCRDSCKKTLKSMKSKESPTDQPIDPVESSQKTTEIKTEEIENKLLDIQRTLMQDKYTDDDIKINIGASKNPTDISSLQTCCNEDVTTEEKQKVINKSKKIIKQRNNTQNNVPEQNGKVLSKVTLRNLPSKSARSKDIQSESRNTSSNNSSPAFMTFNETKDKIIMLTEFVIDKAEKKQKIDDRTVSDAIATDQIQSFNTPAEIVSHLHDRTPNNTSEKRQSFSQNTEIIEDKHALNKQTNLTSSFKITPDENKKCTDTVNVDHNETISVPKNLDGIKTRKIFDRKKFHQKNNNVPSYKIANLIDAPERTQSYIQDFSLASSHALNDLINHTCTFSQNNLDTNIQHDQLYPRYYPQPVLINSFVLNNSDVTNRSNNVFYTPSIGIPLNHSGTYYEHQYNSILQQQPFTQDYSYITNISGDNHEFISNHLTYNTPANQYQEDSTYSNYPSVIPKRSVYLSVFDETNDMSIYAQTPTYFLPIPQAETHRKQENEHDIQPHYQANYPKDFNNKGAKIFPVENNPYICSDNSDIGPQDTLVLVAIPPEKRTKSFLTLHHA